MFLVQVLCWILESIPDSILAQPVYVCIFLIFWPLLFQDCKSALTNYIPHLTRFCSFVPPNGMRIPRPRLGTTDIGAMAGPSLLVTECM